MTAIRNMARQHKEFQSRLDDVQVKQALNASLAKVKFKSKHCEQEAKADGERIARTEKERDEDKHEAKVARLAASAACDTKARVEENLARVQEALATVGEGRRMADAEVSHL